MVPLFLSKLLARRLPRRGADQTPCSDTYASNAATFQIVGKPSLARKPLRTDTE